MGLLTREYDWSNSALGSPDGWPQSLRTTLSIILNSKFPMFLFWGEQLICFYNDAFRPSLGNEGKHPYALGKTGAEVWPEIWSIIKPLIDQVLVEGEATWSEDQLIPIYRNGKIEDVYWTFSYSPVCDESDRRAGVFVTCTETTQKVDNFKNLQLSTQRFKDLVMHAPVAIAVFRGKDFVAELANNSYLPLIGKTMEQFVGKPLFEVLPETREVLEPLAKEVMATGKPLVSTAFEIALHRNGRPEKCFFNSVWEPLLESDGTVNGFMVVAHEVTEQVQALRKAEEAEQKAKLAIDAAELGTYEINLAKKQVTTSERFQAIWGIANTSDIADYMSLIHPADLPAREKAHQESERTGILNYTARLMRPENKVRWVKLSGKVLFDEQGTPARLLGMVQDITEQKIFAEELSRQVEKRTEELMWAHESLLNANDYLQQVINKF